MLLKTDHKDIEALFADYEGLGKKGRGRKKIVLKMIDLLSIHTAIEEQIFYPAVRAAVKRADEIVLRQSEEHHLAAYTISELMQLHEDHPRFHAKVQVLMDNARIHIEAEEEDLFPLVRAGIDREVLNDLGARMEKAKKLVRR